MTSAVPETRRALGELSRYEDEGVNDRFDALVRGVVRLAPQCGGLTSHYLREGLASPGSRPVSRWPCSTVCSTSAEDRASRRRPEARSSKPNGQSPPSESQWAFFAEIAAAGGVRSTLSLPFVREGQVVGG